TPAAYSPSERLARISRAAPCCHKSNGIPNCASRDATAGQPVEVIPAGRQMCRATSDSFFVPVLVLGDDAIGGLLVHLAAQGLNLARYLHLPSRQRGQIACG